MNLDGLNMFNVLCGLASLFVTIAGLFYAVSVARRTERRKLLTFEVNDPLALVTVISDKANYRLSLLYEKPGAEPINIKGAYLSFFRLANLGKEPIRRVDLATSDPLRLEVHEAKVLDLAVASVSREVVDFRANPSGEGNAPDGVFLLSFDFLDYQDGALIRIMTDGPSATIRLRGTIVGMPAGICRFGEAHGIKSLIKRPVTFFVGGLVLFTCTGLPLAILLERQASPSLLLLALIVVPLTMGYLYIWERYVWSPQEWRWPATLRLPGWFQNEQLRKSLFR